MTPAGRQRKPALVGALGASLYRGEPEDAPQAKRCSCETPWLCREEDETLHCVNCGRDYVREVA